MPCVVPTRATWIPSSKKCFEHKDSIFWHYIKSQCLSSIGVPPLKHDGQLYSGMAKKAYIMSKQFQSAFTSDTGNTAPELEGNHHLSISALHASASGIAKLLANLKFCKAQITSCPGPWESSPRTLHHLSNVVFNQSLASGVIPHDWKNAHVSPIHKMGSKHQVPDLPHMYLLQSTGACCVPSHHVTLGWT